LRFIAAATGIGNVVLVNLPVMQMDRVTQQNAALVQESSAAASAMRDQASMLEASIARFVVQ